MNGVMRKSGGVLGNLAALIILTALVNWGLVLIVGRPVLYCAVKATAFIGEAMAFYHYGLLLLVPLAVFSALRSKGAALPLIGFVFLFALAPTLLDTLFNLPPGCAAARGG